MGECVDRARRLQGRPGLRIENSGPVIPADQARRTVPAVPATGRGTGRETRAASGTGSASACPSWRRSSPHGGRVRARTRPQGGLVVEVSLPPYTPAEHRRSAHAAPAV
ncbi:hypothetical protein ACRAWF_04600 [Streptomyces sp. L7]